MAIKINNLENKHRKIVQRLGNFEVLEYARDPSVAPDNAVAEYFMGAMGVRRRQVICHLNGNNSVITQAGAMHWTAGNISSTTGLKGVGDLLGKVVKSKVTNETAIKPEYVGVGTVVLEPSYKYVILQNVEDWGQKGLTIEDGMFLASDGTVQQKVVARTNLSSAIMGNEGLFNLSLQGQGVIALESNVPMDEVIEIELVNDVLKIDGSFAICWSTGLEFTVERSSQTLVGSMINSEGLVNVYRGTGKVLMSPITQCTKSLKATTHNK
ncbi:MAG: AIM24 family protein [Lachnospiraceae bacterium]